MNQVGMGNGMDEYYCLPDPRLEAALSSNAKAKVLTINIREIQNLKSNVMSFIPLDRISNSPNFSAVDSNLAVTFHSSTPFKSSRRRVESWIGPGRIGS